MIEYILGIITGLLLALICMSTMIYFKRIIEHKINIIEKYIENKGPAPKGFLFDPPDEIDEARENIIKKNKEKGRDTPLSELQ